MSENTNSEEKLQEIIPSMDEFKDELNRSFRSVKEGELITGTVIGVTDSEVMIDLGYYAEGIIKITELSNDPGFSIKTDIAAGDSITAVVLREDDGEGNVLLSLKQAHDILSWEILKEAMKNETVYSCKIKEVVNSGVITYVEGIRSFIPASQLALSYVEDLEPYKGKTIDAVVITVDEDKKKLVLSAKQVARERAEKEHKLKVSSLQIGLVTSGVVEKLAPYGAFVKIGDDLSGLVHISQICGRHLKSPKEVLSEGQEVNVKIIDVKDGKISLSIKAVEDKEDIVEDVKDAPIEYTEQETASTSLGALLSNFKFD
ncbi:S1 RNA-binding domain-containing protein [[Clostridium] polysaccharolyticum]|uniref:Small subunit ribosomal protein S1 n=1 Tax=[Clostridium] polysaccharolyticum TaxID=29364 RepID=A0A1I0DA37_9FIRM|nr:S1 RNA-binding domain-containing protein [[Clostridium] polysaccharolyticum]SET28409.1 small subunit ribosomal protein S1 [[Clostridium] polysaccharolyticum]